MANASYNVPQYNSGTPTPVVPEPSKSEGWQSALTTIFILLLAPVIAILLTAFVFQSYQVDGPSMETTLHNNDRLIVWKLPRTWARITKHNYVPKRGDIIIFNESNLGSLSQGDSKQLIKRVIALPGERVTIQDNKYIVYNQAHPTGFEPDATMSYGSAIADTLPETEQTSWTVGAHEVFVSGDNRPDSLDSRTFGPVPTKDIVGKLALRMLPLSNVQKF